MSERLLTPQKYLLPEEISRFRQVLDREAKIGFSCGHQAPVKDAIILHTILGAGLRVSESAALRVGDLILVYGKAEIFIHKSKNDKSRIVKIGQDLKKRLKRYLKWKREQGEPMEEESPLFISRLGKSFSTRGIQKKFHVYMDKAGIEKDCGIHALRHTFGLLLYSSSGHNLRMVQKQLGHSSPSITQIYADVLESDTQEAVDKMFDISLQSKIRKAWEADKSNLCEVE